MKHEMIISDKRTVKCPNCGEWEYEWDADLDQNNIFVCDNCGHESHCKEWETSDDCDHEWKNTGYAEYECTICGITGYVEL